MDTNFQIKIQTFKSLNEPLSILPRTTTLFSDLFKSKDNKVIKRKVFETKKEWLTWRNNVTQELLNQRILSSKYPSKVLTILNYTVQINNHQRNLYITYDCEVEAVPLFQYLNDNSVSYQEQVQIFEQLLQIACILFKSQFEHTNLKPNNILYYKKQVLLTDFGSARTHYQNFIKVYTSQAKKDWQNNLIFFYPQKYQEIMKDDNIDYRNWNELDFSDQKFRKSIDTWALSMMMIQVFENNQKLPDKIINYYGLNNQLLLQKIENLKQYSAGIFSQAIYSLLIEKKDPENVYQTFIKSKQMVNTESSFMESTFIIKQIFDHVNDDAISIHSYKPENQYYLEKQEIEKLQHQSQPGDDASSVRTTNHLIDIINYTEQKPKGNLTLIPIQLPSSRNYSANSRKMPQTQIYEFKKNDNPLEEFNESTSNKGDRRIPTIIVTNYELNTQTNEGIQIEDNLINNQNQQFIPSQSQFQLNNDNTIQFNPINLQPISDDNNEITSINTQQLRNENERTDQLQIIKLVQINEVEQDTHNQSPIINQNQTQPFQFLEVQYLNNIHDKVPITENDKQVTDSEFYKEMVTNDIQIIKSQIYGLVEIEDNQDIESQINRNSNLFNFNQNEENQLLVEITNQEDKVNVDQNRNQQQKTIYVVQNGQKQPVIPIFEVPEYNLIEQNKTNPFSIQIIKHILDDGVTQLQDQEQKNILEQLKMIQKIFIKIDQKRIDPTEILEDEEIQGDYQQIKQFTIEIENQEHNDKLKLIEDVNDGIGFILKKQEVDKIFDNNEIENNPHILNILNEDQLKQVKEKIIDNKIIINQIQQTIEVKDGLKKLKNNKTIQNIIKEQEIGLLNKEELKIYQNLIQNIPKDKRLAKRILVQQSAIERRLQEIKKQEEEEVIKQKLIDFIKNPSYDKLLSNDDLKKLNEEERQKYKKVLETFQYKAQQRQKKSIQEQIDFINQQDKKNKKQIGEDNEKYNQKQQSSKNSNNNKFSDAYMQIINKLAEDNNGEIYSCNKYIKQFQLFSVSYQIQDQIPEDCQRYQQQNKNRKVLYFDYKGSKYKGETVNDQPDGIGILRKSLFSSIYKGYFKQGKFYWGQVLEMNDQGQLTQYIGYYNQEYQVKHGMGKLKWYQPQKKQFCGNIYNFNEYEFYEGNFVFGFIHGKGKKRYDDQSEYDGEWRKNKKEGQGMLKKEIELNNQLKKKEVKLKKVIIYEGFFKDDVLHDKNVKVTYKEDKKPDLIVEGEFKNGKPIGQHKLIFNNIVQRQIDY
ncbi:unnamed protein product [Paramecium sonneborni]|uniref:MORN repeat-containing protein 3 n=1 Tax=Paramecium sonneborni TaxID=65129 RepID=A0A8S1QRL4_9CILI|nr:unnamed protein product [Paramecium sonneborni]